jgi:hypothetical protein
MLVCSFVASDPPLPFRFLCYALCGGILMCDLCVTVVLLGGSILRVLLLLLL